MRPGKHEGFTLIELMIVVLIIGVLAAIAIPNFLAMRNRAKEGAVKSNMHTFQLAAEDYATQNDGVYAIGSGGAQAVSTSLPRVFTNPFTKASGDQGAWMNGAAGAPGVVGYEGNPSDSTTKYTITGFGALQQLSLTLRNGP